MTAISLIELRRFLIDRYDVLKEQLTRRLGSPDLAGDALHDTYLRLAGKEDIDTVRNPQAFLINAAVHIAIDKIRVDARTLSEAEVGDLFDLKDPAAGPARTAQARQDLARVVSAMEKLPARQRDILVAARLEDVSREELAKRYGISVRMVALELRAAHEYCVRKLGR